MTRRQRRKTFKVMSISNMPVVQYISIHEGEREDLYREFKCDGITLPEYYKLNRLNMCKEDLLVLKEPWSITFEYQEEGSDRVKEYNLFLDKGLIFDAASIPWFLTFGHLNKRGQQVLRPSLVHDVIFSLHLFSFNDCNNIFRGLLEYEGGAANVTKRRYFFGVNSPIGRIIYNKSNPEDSWHKKFVTKKVIK